MLPSYIVIPRVWWDFVWRLIIQLPFDGQRTYLCSQILTRNETSQNLTPYFLCTIQDYLFLNIKDYYQFTLSGHLFIVQHPQNLQLLFLNKDYYQFILSGHIFIVQHIKDHCQFILTSTCIKHWLFMTPDTEDYVIKEFQLPLNNLVISFQRTQKKWTSEILALIP